MNEELLTIKEFAEQAKVSRSAVYKAIKAGRIEVAKKAGGNTFLLSTELEKFQPFSTKLEHIQPIFNQNQPLSTDSIQPFSTAGDGGGRPPALDSEIKKAEQEAGGEAAALSKLVDMLQEQLAVKDKQIADLSERLAEALQLTRGLQYITAADKTTDLIEAQSQSKYQKQEENSGAETATIKEGFLKKIFGKRRG